MECNYYMKSETYFVINFQDGEVEGYDNLDDAREAMRYLIVEANTDIHNIKLIKGVELVFKTETTISVMVR